jgi:hypothetical protein
VGGIIGETKQSLSASNAEIKTIVLEMQPILERQGFKLDDDTPALARFRTSIGYEACYSFSHRESASLFQCRIDGDRERFEIQFIEWATAHGSFTMTAKDRGFIDDTARLLRDHLQAKFPNRKVHVSFTSYD